MICDSCNTYELIGGARTKLEFEVFGNTGQAFNLSVFKGWFSMVPAINPIMAPVISKQMTVKTDQSGNATNILSVILTSKETGKLSGKYIYQVTIYNSTGQAEVPERGEIIIHRNIDMAPLEQWEWEDET